MEKIGVPKGRFSRNIRPTNSMSFRVDSDQWSVASRVHHNHPWAKVISSSRIRD